MKEKRTGKGCKRAGRKGKGKERETMKGRNGGEIWGEDEMEGGK